MFKPLVFCQISSGSANVAVKNTLKKKNCTFQDVEDLHGLPIWLTSHEEYCFTHICHVKH